jgi:MSHA biogenesis protein MshJ
MNALRAVWRKLADRVDVLSLRERVMVLIAALALLGAGYYSVAWGPMSARQVILLKQIRKTEGERQAILAQIAELPKAQAADPDAAARARLAEIRSEAGEIERFVAERQGRLVPPERMSALLQEVLATRGGVRMASLTTLPVQPLGEPGSAAAGQVFRHGVQFTVEGPYLELLAYLEALERMPWQVFWSRSVLDAKSYPRVTLTVTVLTLSLDRAWLKV